VASIESGETRKRGRESFLRSTPDGIAVRGRAAYGGREMTPDPFSVTVPSSGLEAVA